MVDFNNNQTVTTAPKDLLNIMILERRFNLLEAIESYIRNKLKNNIDDLNEVRSRLFALFSEVEAPLMNSLKEDVFENLKNKIMYSEEYNEIFENWSFLNRWLYEKGLIKFDIQKVYDGTNPEEENEVNGIN